jgi:Recombination endonuclease VII
MYEDKEKRKQSQREWYARNKDNPEFKERRKKSKSLWRNKNLEYHRKYYRTRRYDITYEEFLDLLKIQDYKCAICSCKITEESSKIDHNHLTNKVRKILCAKCNIGLGQFDDSIMLLNKAIQYLLEN